MTKSVAEPLTREDIQRIRETAASEIVRRLENPAAMKALTGAQLASLTRDLVKLTEPMFATSAEGDGDLDLAELIARLPVNARKDHLLRERESLEAKLEYVESLLGDDVRQRRNAKEVRYYRNKVKERPQPLIALE